MQVLAKLYFKTKELVPVLTCLLVLVILLAKREIAENDRDPALWLLAMAIGLQVCQDMFHDVSGGFVNPALAFG